MTASFLALAVLGTAAVLLGSRLWPRDDPQDIEHAHPELDAAHPHLRGRPADAAGGHRHEYVIDDEHRSWPP